jgi:feruloyl esterase
MKHMITLGVLLFVVVQIASGGSTTIAAGASETTCANMATSVAKFPVANTRITMAKFNADGATKEGDAPLPAHCQIQGVINSRIGVDGVRYGDIFELRMPLNWNGRFMFQGGGGTKGSLVPATGIAGTATPTLAKGYAVVSNDGGHEDSLLKKQIAFGMDPQARLDLGYQTDDRTARTAKVLINEFYGKMPDYSYHVGCSLGGQEGMQFSQRFPSYFDGIIAGDPVYDLSAIGLSEVNGLQALATIVPKGEDGPEYYKAFSKKDQDLFTRAILTACDKLDGLEDGVVDNDAACKFDPKTFVFPETKEPLKCAGAKTDNCLSAAQVAAIERIKDGPRTSAGKPVVVPTGTTVVGYPYGAGFMASAGVPLGLMGTATRPPAAAGGNHGADQVAYFHLSPPDPTFNYLSFNYDKDVQRGTKDNPLVANSTDLSAFKKRGGKILWYHGYNDAGPSALYTINYYNALTKLNGGVAETQKFARMFLIPNMGHCRGGPATDDFDMLTPLVNWVEKGQAPDSIVASGKNFTTPPARRSRPLCAYPTIAKYTGPAGGDIGDAKNYGCATP